VAIAWWVPLALERLRSGHHQAGRTSQCWYAQVAADQLLLAAGVVNVPAGWELRARVGVFESPFLWAR